MFLGMLLDIRILESPSLSELLDKSYGLSILLVETTVARFQQIILQEKTDIVRRPWLPCRKLAAHCAQHTMRLASNNPCEICFLERPLVSASDSLPIEQRVSDIFSVRT